MPVVFIFSCSFHPHLFDVNVEKWQNSDDNEFRHVRQSSSFFGWSVVWKLFIFDFSYIQKKVFTMLWNFTAVYFYYKLKSLLWPVKVFKICFKNYSHGPTELESWIVFVVREYARLKLGDLSNKAWDLINRAQNYWTNWKICVYAPSICELFFATDSLEIFEKYTIIDQVFSEKTFWSPRQLKNGFRKNKKNICSEGYTENMLKWSLKKCPWILEFFSFLNGNLLYKISLKTTFFSRIFIQKIFFNNLCLLNGTSSIDPPF